MIDMPDVDYLVKGEGELVLSRLVTSLVEGNDVSNIRGLYYRFNNEILYQGDCDLIPDLDVLPYPAWGHVDLRKYDVFNPGAKTVVPTFPLLSSRGCPNSCTFCDSQSVFKRRLRGRSAENIIDEVIFLHDRYGMVEFDFVDQFYLINKGSEKYKLSILHQLINLPIGDIRRLHGEIELDKIRILDEEKYMDSPVIKSIHTIMDIHKDTSKLYNRYEDEIMDIKHMDI